MARILVEKTRFLALLLLLSMNVSSVFSLEPLRESNEVDIFMKNNEFATRMLQQSRNRSGNLTSNRNRSGNVKALLSSRRPKPFQSKKGLRKRVRQRDRFVPVIGGMGIVSIVTSGLLLLISGDEGGTFTSLQDLFNVDDMFSRVTDLPNGERIIEAIQDSIDASREILNDVVDLFNTNDVITNIQDILNGNDLFSGISDIFDTDNIISSIMELLDVESIINDIEEITGGGELLTTVSSILDGISDINFTTLTDIFELLDVS